MSNVEHVSTQAQPRRSARPRWSLKSSFYTALGIVVLVTPLVLLTVRKSIWTELEVLTGVVSAIMFVYLTTVLFLGVRFDRNERFTIALPEGNPGDFFTTAVDLAGCFTQWGAEAGVLGLVIGFFLDIVATVLICSAISFLLWLGVNGFLAVILAVCIPLFFFYRRVLRSIVTKGRRCRGNVRASLFQAFRSTLGYAVWFYGIFLLAQYVEHVRLN